MVTIHIEWYNLVAMIVLGIAGITLTIYMMRKPFSKLSSKAAWSLTTPKVSLMVQKNNAKILEIIHKQMPGFTFEEKALLLQEVMGKDIKILAGLNRQGEWWIDAVTPYNYSEMIGSFGGSGGEE